jgi:hypothetical protein
MPLLAWLLPGMDSTSKKAVLNTGGPSASKADESRAAAGGSLLVGPSSPEALAAGVSVDGACVTVVVAAVVEAGVADGVVVSACFGVGANLWL